MTSPEEKRSRDRLWGADGSKRPAGFPHSCVKDSKLGVRPSVRPSPPPVQRDAVFGTAPKEGGEVFVPLLSPGDSSGVLQFPRVDEVL